MSHSNFNQSVRQLISLIVLAKPWWLLAVNIKRRSTLCLTVSLIMASIRALHLTNKRGSTKKVETCFNLKSQISLRKKYHPVLIQALIIRLTVKAEHVSILCSTQLTVIKVIAKVVGEIKLAYHLIKTILKSTSAPHNMYRESLPSFSALPVRVPLSSRVLTRMPLQWPKLQLSQ